MSISKEITIWCDGEECPLWRQESGTTAKEIRKHLMGRGWGHVGNKDFCADHRPELRRVRKSKGSKVK